MRWRCPALALKPRVCLSFLFKPMTNPSDNPAELFWQAFRYAGDEMSADERVSFENQLATDQHAREAVARVIELESLVCAAEVLPAQPLAVLPRDRSYWMQPIGWAAAGAAACLAVVMTLQTWSPANWQAGQTAGQLRPGVAQVAGNVAARGNQQAVDRESVPGPAGELALVWAQARLEVPAPDALEGAGSEQLIEGDELASAADEQTAPNWLLAAVADGELVDHEN